MIDGHKIRNKDWFIKGAFGHFKNGKFLYNNQGEDEELFNAMKFENGYEVYQESKKAEKVVQYRIIYHNRSIDYHFDSGQLFKSKQDFLKTYGKKEDCYHWVKLEEVYSHEYEVNE